MDITLTPEFERLIHDKVASGLYTSEDEVIREALRLLKDRDELRILAIEDLRWEVQKGLDQLDGGLVASRHLLTVKRAEVDGVPAVMSNVSAMNTASYFAHPDLMTRGSWRKNDLQQERLDSCGPPRT